MRICNRLPYLTLYSIVLCIYKIKITKKNQNKTRMYLSLSISMPLGDVVSLCFVPSYRITYC